MKRAPIARFWPKVKQTDTCWIWQAGADKLGYGRFFDGSRVVLAHRWAYEHFVGPIPPDLKHLDHLCRNPACVNPAHLEPVTPYENNVVRGRGWCAQASRKTHCPRGHEYTPENTRVRGDTGHRVCITCKRERDRDYYLRTKLTVLEGGRSDSPGAA